MGLIWLILGIVFESNRTWFGGAHTIGHIMVIVGIIELILEVGIGLLVLAIGLASARESKRF